MGRDWGLSMGGKEGGGGAADFKETQQLSLHPLPAEGSSLPPTPPTVP